MQTTPEGMGRRHYLTNACVGRCATHEAGTWRPASPQVAHRFEAFQKALPRLGPASVRGCCSVGRAVVRAYVTTVHE
jgi:hypothetical protein